MLSPDDFEIRPEESTEAGGEKTWGTLNEAVVAPPPADVLGKPATAHHARARDSLRDKFPKTVEQSVVRKTQFCGERRHGQLTVLCKPFDKTRFWRMSAAHLHTLE
jgi:hypothetical protein